MWTSTGTIPRRGTAVRKKRAWNLFFLALPLMILVILFRYLPLAGWIVSLYEYKAGYSLFACDFVGLKYFRLLFTSADFMRVMKNTLIFAVIGFVALPLPMLLAILLNEIGNSKFRRIAQTLTTLPHFLSWIIVYSIAFILFGSEGLINAARKLAGLRPDQMGILNQAQSVYWFQSVLTIWKTLGWSAIIYIAAVAGIDQELYEAAYVDGAGRLRCAIHITIPGLMPTLIVMMLLCVSNFVNLGYEQYYVFKNPIVYDNIEVIDVFTYRLGLQLSPPDYSYSTAVGIFKSFVSVILLTAANSVAKMIRGEGIV